MSRDTKRAGLLAACLLGAALDGVVVHGLPRLAVGIVLLGGAALAALQIVRGSGRLEAEVAELRSELEQERRLVAELASKVAQLETAQKLEIADLRASRQRHVRDVNRLHDRVEAHKRELDALAQVLDDADRPLSAAATRL